MRKIKATMFISLDGVVEAPDQWHFPYFNDEMGVAVDRVLGKSDTMLLGRKTYDSFAGAWPDREAAGGEDAGFAKVLGDARKIIVSHQNLELQWRNSELLKGGLVEAVTALKNEPGDTHIAMSGSPSIVRQLLDAGLLDELHLLVHPITVRKGIRLFDEAQSPIPLKLISSKTLETGVLDLVYGPAESTGDGTYATGRDRKRLEAGAVSELQGIARFKFHEGELEEFKRLSAQCMEIVRTKDTGTLQYDIYFNDDQSECIVLERYRDSEALIEHAAHLGDVTEAILATGSVSGELLGEPSAELRAKLADSVVRLFTPFLSM